MHVVKGLKFTCNLKARCKAVILIHNLSHWPTWCTNFNTFITILYMCMFQAISCSSSGGQIVLIQHLVLPLSISDRPVRRLRKNCFPVLSQPFSTGRERISLQFFLNLCTGLSLNESDNTRCCINTIWPPEDEQDIARNM